MTKFRDFVPELSLVDTDATSIMYRVFQSQSDLYIAAFTARDKSANRQANVIFLTLPPVMRDSEENSEWVRLYKAWLGDKRCIEWDHTPVPGCEGRNGKPRTLRALVKAAAKMVHKAAVPRKVLAERHFPLRSLFVPCGSDYMLNRNRIYTSRKGAGAKKAAPLATIDSNIPAALSEEEATSKPSLHAEQEQRATQIQRPPSRAYIDVDDFDSDQS